MIPDWLVVGAIAVVSLVVFPFFVLLVAKLLAFGWYAGRERFLDQEKRRKEKYRGT